MYQEREDRFYYITLYNEDYPMPEMPRGLPRGHSQGIYKYKAAASGKAAVQLFGSGPILNEALRAQEHPGGEVRRRGGRMERNQLQRASPRRAGGGALEPSASRRAGEASAHSSALEGCGRPDHRGQRLHEGRARPACAVAPGPAGDAGHRRLRAQRQSRVSAAAFRGQRRIDRRQRRCRGWRGKGSSTWRRREQRFEELGVNTEKIDPATA